jgi:hypothetical protein
MVREVLLTPPVIGSILGVVVNVRFTAAVASKVLNRVTVPEALPVPAWPDTRLGGWRHRRLKEKTCFT